MKRIKAACICQTLRFQLKEGVEPREAAALARKEAERYKAGLERSSTRFRLLEETVQPDGSILIKLIKQYNHSPVGDYLD